MINELIKLMKDQEKDLTELFGLLEIQYKMIMSKDVFGLEGLVDKINECGKRIAQEEVKRRRLTEDIVIKDIVIKTNDDELNQIYEKIQNTLNKVVFQKETNELFLKKQIVFNNKMINLMNPNREIKMYNSYGNLSR